MAGRYPNFFIAGAAKAGTTFLFEYFMSPIKEPHFFSPDAAKNPGAHQRVVDWDAYVRLFAGATGEIAIGEASPSYLWDRESPRLIRERLPDAKIIIVLRDPVDRAYSHYLADVRLGWQSLPFLEALQADARQVQKGWGISHLYLELGEYSEQVARYLETFSQDAVRAILSEDLRQDAHRCVSEVLLGVPEVGSLAGASPADNVFCSAARAVGEICDSKRHGQGAGEALRPCGFTGMDPRHRSP